MKKSKPIHEALKAIDSSEKILSPDLFVYLVKNLPAILMGRHGVLLPFEKDKKSKDKFFSIIRKQYTAVGTWLDYLLLKQPQMAPELVLTETKYYKPLAEKTMNELNLAEEIFLIDDFSQAEELYPLEWILRIEVYACERLLEKYWYFDNPPKAQGKEKDRLSANSYYSRLATTDFRRIKNNPTSLPPKEALDQIGACLGSVDSKFNLEVFQPYIKKMKQIERKIRICPYLKKISVDEDGNVKLLTQRHQRLL